MRLFEGTQFDRPPRCEKCEELEEDCVCPPEPEPRTRPNKQTARVGVEKRKGGRLMTTIRDLKDEGTHLEDLFSTLKSAIGAGGAIKDGVIEIQGDQRDRVCEKLKEMDYKVKRVGG